MSSHTNSESFEELLALGPTAGSIEHLYAIRLELRHKADTMAEIQKLATATKRAGTWITPTLMCGKGGQENGGTQVERSSALLVKALQDAGVGMLLGADIDAGGGRYWPHVVHEELANLVAAGLTPYQALLTGTRNVAQYFGLLDSSGTVGVGKRAELVLLYANPLTNVRHTMEVAGVMSKNRWLDRAALDERLFASPEASKAWFTRELRDGLLTTNFGGQYWQRVDEYGRKFTVLLDSLAGSQPKSAEYERVLGRLTKELGAMRMLLPLDRQAMFDPSVRVWLRQQARQGYQVAVPGVTPIP